MPLLIFHCRTRLFSAFIRQRTILGGARTCASRSSTVARTVNDFHIISHRTSSITLRFTQIYWHVKIIFTIKFCDQNAYNRNLRYYKKNEKSH